MHGHLSTLCLKKRPPPHQGRIQEFAKGGGGDPSPTLTLAFPFSFLLFLSSFLEVGPLKPARGSGERCKLPQLGPGQSLAENEFGALYSCQKAAGGNRFEYSEYHVLQ